MTTDEAQATVALLRYTGARDQWQATAALLREHSPLELLHRWLPTSALAPDPVAAVLERAADDLALWHRTAHVLALREPGYPDQLREVHDAPPLLFTRGVVSQDRGACIVGSRSPSQQALDFAHTTAAALAGRGIPVVSGLAAGIDTAAHTGALDHHGRTIAVLGTGIDHTDPVQDGGLQEEISRQGLVVSQFWPHSPPSTTTIPQQTATLSGYGLCTLIVTAGENSRTRIQARQAIAHGRPLLLTREVAHNTNWGRRLATSPYDVQVVSSPRQTVAAIQEILRRPASTAALLDELAR